MAEQAPLLLIDPTALESLECSRERRRRERRHREDRQKLGGYVLGSLSIIPATANIRHLLARVCDRLSSAGYMKPFALSLQRGRNRQVPTHVLSIFGIFTARDTRAHSGAFDLYNVGVIKFGCSAPRI